MNKIIILVFFILITSGCNKGTQSKDDCGCNSTVDFTIENSVKQIGYLYKNNDYLNTNVPEYNYGIWYNYPNCSNCIDKFLVCNDDYLKNITNIPNYPGIRVVFSGEVKKLCIPPYSPADYKYYHITLTKIETL
jgi:hypothetical protein